MPYPVTIRGAISRAVVTTTFAGASRSRVVGAPVRPLLGPRGTKRIAGDVKVISTPAPYRTVRLYHRASGALIAETQADAAGNWAFPGVFNALGNTEYYVVALDTQPGGYNAVIADLIVPE